MDEVSILYLVSGVISLLLTISEALGLSGYRANSITEVVLAMVKARIKQDEEDKLTEPVAPSS